MIKKYIIENKYPILAFSIPLIIGLILSIFRYPGIDETIYLHDTAMIQHFISNGEWIGNESVGTHGFVFKLLVALVFLITGKSIFVATLSNIIFASLTSLLTYYLAEKILNNRIYAFFVSLIMISSYQFMGQFATYLRDMPATFAMLLFILALLNKKNICLLSLLLLLVFDAKEYVAILLIPPFMIWLLFSEYQKFGLKNIRFYGNIIYKPVLALLPIAIWVYLMFWTSIIPVNTFIGSMLNFYDTGTDYSKMQGFNAEQLLIQANDTTGKGFKVIPLIAQESDKEINNNKKVKEPIRKRLTDEYKAAVNSKPTRKIIVATTKQTIAEKSIPKKSSKADSIKLANLRIKQKEALILAKLKQRQQDSIKLLIAFQKTQDSIKSLLEKNRILDSIKLATDRIKKLDSTNLAKSKKIKQDSIKLANSKIDTTKLAIKKSEPKPLDSIQLKIQDSIKLAKLKQKAQDSAKFAIIRLKQQDSIKLALEKGRLTDSANKAIAIIRMLDSIELARVKKKEEAKNKLLAIDNNKAKLSDKNKNNITTSVISEQKLTDYESTSSDIYEEKFTKDKVLQFKKQQLDSLRRDKLGYKLEQYGITIANYLLAYSQKILYPRVFSYLSLPLLILIPAVFMAFRSYQEWKISAPEFVFLSIYLATYLMVYIMRNSHGRYLIHLFPVLLLFFFRYLNDFEKYRKLFSISLAVAFIMSIASLYFEVRDVEIKALSYLWFFGLLALLFVPALNKNAKIRKLIIYSFIGTFAFFNFGISIYANYNQAMIRDYINYGNADDFIKPILKHIDKDDKVWINYGQRSRYFQFLRGDLVDNMYGWNYAQPERYTLKEFLPKKKLNSYFPPKTEWGWFYHNPTQRTNKFFIRTLEAGNYTKVIFFVSKIEEMKYWDQDGLDEMKKLEYLELIKEFNFKNQDVYIFKVKYEN